MPINLHFFRDNSLDKLDFARVFDFFDQLGYFEIFYTEDDVQIIAKDEDFRFSYRYLITKKSLVKDIYKLNPKYSNVNFMIELPIMIPSYLAKEIFAIISKLCRSFDLAIYHDSFKDVQEFNIVDLDNLFNSMRQKYIEDYGYGNKRPYDSKKLSEICKYQRSIEQLATFYEGRKITVPKVQAIEDSITKDFGISCMFRAGEATIFPPHLDYIYVHDELNNVILVPRANFFSVMGKYLIEIEAVLPDMYILREKQARSSRKVASKLRKFAIDHINYTNLRLCDLIDEQNS